MSKIMEILGILLGLIPIVVSLIKSFEVPGFGAEKKKAVLDAVGLLHDSLSITAISKEKLLGIVGGLCDIVVGLFNAVGWFKKENPTPNT
uniref:Uncharacterized protein n=1 Tax=viral metagenome TaxID=1070528 RepID=A0A6M3L0X9_9ZZZZ